RFQIAAVDGRVTRNRTADNHQDSEGQPRTKSLESRDVHPGGIDTSGRQSKASRTRLRSCLARRLWLQCFDAPTIKLLSRAISYRFDDDLLLWIRVRANESAQRAVT